MQVIKDMAIAAFVGAVLGELLLRFMTAFGVPIPLEDGKKPVFIVGIILFSLVFRLMMHVRQNPEETPD